MKLKTRRSKVRQAKTGSKNQKLIWRLRTVIQTEVIISIGEIEGKNTIFRVFAIDNSNTENGDSVSETLRYCDVIKKEPSADIFEAYAFLYDEVNNFLDRYSMVSYGTASIANIRSICPESVSVGEEFDLAIPQISAVRTTLPIQLNDLGIDTEMTPHQQRWLRLLRNGLNSPSEEERYINFYVILEEIAQEESKEFIITKCKNPNCLQEINTGRKATNNFIKNILNEHRLEVRLTRKAPELRNKIAHGGGKKDKAYIKDLREVGSYLEEICLLELEKRLPLDIHNRLNSHVIDVPIIKHRCTCAEDKSFDLIQSTHQIPVRFVKLPYPEESAFAGQAALIGMPLDNDGRPIIDPFSWPNIINE